MAKNLDKVQTVVIVHMENRSFDHILGYLSLPEFGHPNADRIEGVRQARLFYSHSTYQPKPLQNLTLDPDPPHEREDIAKQINDPLLGPMAGFVRSYQRVYDALRTGAPSKLSSD